MKSDNKQLMLAMAVILCLAGILTGCGTIRKSPNFNQRANEIQTVSIIAPDISLQKIVFKGDNQPLFEESKNASKRMAQMLEAEFKKKGYEVTTFEMTSALRESDPELEFELGKLKEKYSLLTGDVQKQFVSKMKWKDFKLTLGSDVNRYADLARSDVLVFATGAGFVKSGGEITKDVTKSLLIGAASLGTFIPIYDSYGGQIHISVIDGDNGDILWHNFTNPHMTYNMTKDKTVDKMVKDTVKKYPKRKMAAREKAIVTGVQEVTSRQLQPEIQSPVTNIPLEQAKT